MTTIFDRATRANRTCGTCLAWHREATSPMLNLKGEPERFLMGGACHVVGKNTRGSDTCGNWTRLVRFHTEDDSKV